MVNDTEVRENTVNDPNAEAPRGAANTSAPKTGTAEARTTRETPAKRPRRRAGRRDFGTIKNGGTPTAPSFSVRWYEGGRMRRKRGFTTRTDAAAHLARVRVA